MTIEIKHRYSGKTIYASESAQTLRDAVIEAIAARANLARANLAGANLAGANLADARNVPDVTVTEGSGEPYVRLAGVDVPELPEVGLDHRIAELSPPQLLELAALCIAHYREMTK